MTDESQTLVGRAVDAKVGAMLITEEDELWVDLDSWPSGVHGKTVRVTGTWTSKRDLPVFEDRPGEPIRSGMPVPVGTDLEAAATRRVLTEVRWEILGE